MTSIGKVQIPKLPGSENYTIWSVRLKAVLTKEDLIRSAGTTTGTNWQQ
jgi:hypothetical protein